MDTHQKEITTRIEKWIEAGRNPGIAHWHGALEATMASFKPHLQPGSLIPVHTLDKSEYALFEELYGALDLCPDIQAAYIPKALGGVLTPPAAVDSLRRVHRDNTSTMLLCRRPGNQPRILCAEISPEAWKPGVDLFEEGALLGNYEYDSSPDCIGELSNLIRTHLWRKEKWTEANYVDYTLNWFTRVVETGRTDVPVQPDFSYIHSPVLLNMGNVDAIFKLIYGLAAKQVQTIDPRGEDKPDLAAAADETSRHRFLEGRILSLLNLLRDSQAVDFNAFTSRENEQFKDGFTGTVQKLDRFLSALK
ncbi:MAG: hypothetical protein GY697_16415 [Desulfobacterales bacterium]|nr:hypothetical protein [Desulfobacterales bacterium]